MTNTPPTPLSRPASTRRAVLAVVAVAVVASAGWAVIGAAVARRTGPGIDPTDRFIAFSFLAMTLAWLVSVLLLDRRLSWAALFRWAVLIDSAGVALVVAAALSGAVDWLTGVRLYAVLACFAAVQLALFALVVRLGGGAGPAAAGAIAAAVVACTSLLWGHLPLEPVASNSAASDVLLTVVRYVNPLLAANDALNPPTTFDWPRHGQMYHRWGIVGEARAWTLPLWWRASLAYLAVASFVGAIAALGRRLNDAAPPTDQA